ncbi:MAG: hypothetical protein A2636_03190 [Elusimicrobia bacterium RIFCSPHIGHO2_01_FULL_64_10]|nr:MAG: hypothetical protein A2636_03190 [Elusimicrobia bacterium RIFCSPHIGHO2_01_FULL_64_10]
MATEACVVFLTAANREEAEKISRTLVTERLAACVNQAGEVRSRYWWDGKIETGAEILVIAKTTRRAFPRLQKRVRELHSYSVPEVIALPVIDGNPAYLRWIKDSLKQSR